MACGGFHVLSLACVFLCYVRLSLTVEDEEEVLTALVTRHDVKNDETNLTFNCDEGHMLDLSQIEWSTTTDVGEAFQRACSTEETENQFDELCDQEKECNLSIRFDPDAECFNQGKLYIRYFCRDPQHAHLAALGDHLEARNSSCPPCPDEPIMMMETLEILLFILVAVLFVTNLIQIICFLYIAKKKHPPPPVEQPAGQAAGLRLEQATTARRLPVDYADKLTTVPVQHFTTGTIAKSVPGTKKKVKVMGAKPQPAQHRFSLLVATPDASAPSADSARARRDSNVSGV